MMSPMQFVRTVPMLGNRWGLILQPQPHRVPESEATWIQAKSKPIIVNTVLGSGRPA